MRTPSTTIAPPLVEGGRAPRVGRHHCASTTATHTTCATRVQWHCAQPRWCPTSGQCGGVVRTPFLHRMGCAYQCSRTGRGCQVCVPPGTSVARDGTERRVAHGWPAQHPSALAAPNNKVGHVRRLWRRHPRLAALVLQPQPKPPPHQHHLCRRLRRGIIAATSVAALVSATRGLAFCVAGSELRHQAAVLMQLSSRCAVGGLATMCASLVA